ncbi:SCO7613 C-terminal domain-containing membrane protein [Streptomyces sp. NPDC015346]|uniref:SCO7613 C-terminal domain-containing membrane protein n=1 Tax=Streptomyces sp. NPDC015346 TaxID=3364954 RepID=UPI0036FE77E6
MDNALPPADELVLVDRELAQLDARRSQLMARRAWLLQVLRQVAAAPHPVPPRPVADSTPRSAQNVLLTLGGALLTIAAVAFTLVSWGSMGIGGRAAVLFVVTSAALSVPVVLLRRGLASTAEAVAALGLALMVLDAYALHRAALTGTDALAYAAVASAVLAGAWAAYGSALGRLRVPLPTAVVAAQLPLPLGVLAADGGPLALAWAALATAVLDLAVVLWMKPAAVRTTACAGAGVLGGWALLTGARLSLTSPIPAGALLLACAALALCLAWRAARVAVAGSAVAGLAAVVAVGGVLRAVVPGDWVVAGYVLCGVALAGVLRSSAPRAVKLGLAGAGGGVLALGVAWALPPAVAALVTPAARTTEVWSGEHAARYLTSYPSTAPLVLLLATAALAPVPRLRARCGALFLAWATLTALPLSLELPYAATVSAQLLTTAAALYAAIRPGILTRGVPVPAPGPAAGRDGLATAAERGTTDAERADAGAGEPEPGLPTGAGTRRESDAPTDAETVGPEPALGTGAGTRRESDAPTDARADGPEPALGSAAPESPPAHSGGPGSGTDSAGAPRGFGAARQGWGAGGTTAAASRAASPGMPPREVLAWSGLGCGLASAASATALALDTRAATFAALGVLLGLLTAVAFLADGARRAVAACAAVVAATGLVLAGAAASELADHHTALALLAVPAATAAVGARLRRHPVAPPLEITGAAVGLLSLGFADSRPAVLALVLALGGVIAAATAVRPERRVLASWTAAGLFLLATWVRLAVWDVETPEAYTLPVSVPALVVGVLRRRRDPEASSWTAYGPGLAATLLPSLATAWADPHWTRPLLLGAAALVVTLLGARFRLQALLVLGGAVLALDALHELAPYVVQVVGALPRWLPPALAGVLLLAVGATYEQRLRDARRLRERLGRMR